MRDSLSNRLLHRELQDSAGRSRKVRAIYGDKNWVRNLDIVNELDGHSGCVNALRFAVSRTNTPCFSSTYIPLVGPSLADFLLQAQMISISTSTPTSPTIRLHNSPWLPLLPLDIAPTYSPSNSCHIPTIVLSSLLPATAKFASSISNIQALQLRHQGRLQWPNMAAKEDCVITCLMESGI